MEYRIRNKENEAILESITLDRLQNFIHISIFRLLYVIIYRGIKEGIDEGQKVRASQVIKGTTDFFCFKSFFRFSQKLLRKSKELNVKSSMKRF